MLAVPVGRHAMATIQRSRNDRILQLQRTYHRAGRQQVQAQPAPRHFVDDAYIVGRELMENILVGPSALEAQSRCLRNGNTREAHRSYRTSAHRSGRTREEAATRSVSGLDCT